VTTLILGALEAEIAGFRFALSRRQEVKWHNETILVGRLAESEVIVAWTGVGKTMSAMATQHLIDAFEPGRIVFTGIAGALNHELDIGDVVVAREMLQYDLDARAAGFELGRVPFTDFRIIPSDPQLLEAALTYRPSGFRVIPGRILTGDLFLSRWTDARHEYLVSELCGDAVEMEGASAGLVALVNRIPFLLLRVLSDRVDGSATADFKTFLPKASERSYEIVRHVLAVVGQQKG